MNTCRRSDEFGQIAKNWDEKGWNGKKLNGFSCIELRNQMKRFLSPSNTSSFFIVLLDFTVHTVYLIQSFFLFVFRVFVNACGRMGVCLPIFPLHVPRYSFGSITSWNCILTIPMFVESKYKYHAYGYAIQVIVREFPCHHTTWYIYINWIGFVRPVQCKAYCIASKASPHHCLCSSSSAQ